VSPATGFEGPNEGPLGGAILHSAFFDVLGVRPLIGGFAPEDFEAAGETLPILIGYDLWQRRFGGDPSIVGRLIDGPGPGPRARIAGVMPAGFVIRDALACRSCGRPPGRAGRRSATTRPSPGSRRTWSR
jgi:hypothetical protein